jgi:hypothetical protein
MIGSQRFTQSFAQIFLYDRVTKIYPKFRSKLSIGSDRKVPSKFLSKLSIGSDRKVHSKFHSKLSIESEA